MLDQPAPILGNKSPRAAAKTAKGRAKVTDWLKMLENSAAKFTGRNSDMASYNFAWLWAELHGITPLGFLLSLMRDANNDPALRLRAAGLVAPYLHPKGEPNEARGEMRVVDDPYGFGADIGDTQKSIEQAQERLRSLPPTISTGWQDFEEYFAADEKAQQTPAYLELEKIIAEKQAALKCPPNYKELDSRQDRARLKELETEGKKRPLAAAEEHEQKHLHGRLAAYALTPESADCARMNFLKALRADLLTPEEKDKVENIRGALPRCASRSHAH